MSRRPRFPIFLVHQRTNSRLQHVEIISWTPLILKINLFSGDIFLAQESGYWINLPQQAVQVYRDSDPGTGEESVEDPNSIDDIVGSD